MLVLMQEWTLLKLLLTRAKAIMSIFSEMYCRGHLFIKGEVVKVVEESEMVNALIEEGRLLSEQGVEARLAAADKNASKIAEEDVKFLLNNQGDINNLNIKKKTVTEIISNEDIDEENI